MARLLSLSSPIDVRKFVLMRRIVEKLRSAEADDTGSVSAIWQHARRSGKAEANKPLLTNGSIHQQQMTVDQFWTCFVQLHTVLSNCLCGLCALSVLLWHQDRQANQAGVMNLSRESYCKVYVSCPLHSIKSNIQQVNLKQRWITFSPYIIIWMINHWASIIVVFQKFWGAGHRFGGPVPPGPNVKPPLYLGAFCSILFYNYWRNNWCIQKNR